MSKPTIIVGNIFTTQCQTIVNTVNCVGVMGAGIALECKYRYPKMFEQYVKLCNEGKLDIGLLWIFKESLGRWVLNFPTKKHWKDYSREEFLHAGLEKFESTYKSRGIESIAFPILGAQNGGISGEKSLSIMLGYLDRCDIPIEIYQHDPHTLDDKYFEFKCSFLLMSDLDVKQQTGLRIDLVQRVRDALHDSSICQLNQLARVKGIGDKTLERVFSYVTERGKDNAPMQLHFE
jgi:O-acetyl-ADP-ribose deacetylase (regulator of RNase III)